MYFGYRKYNGKVWPVRLLDKPIHHETGKEKEGYVQLRVLPIEIEDMSLSELEAIYPYQAPPEET